MKTKIRTTRRTQELPTEVFERAESYAKAHGLDVDALIAAAITMSVPEHIAATATPDVLELERRAIVLTTPPLG
jgi:hypothetical protein